MILPDFMHSKTANTLLKILLKHGKKSEAWELFKDIFDWEFFMPGQPFGVKRFDSDTINIMVNECFELDMFMKAMHGYFQVGKVFFSVYKNIIERFCERGMMSEVEPFLMKCGQTKTWSCLMKLLQLDQ